MWKKRIFYFLIALGLSRLGLSLYSMIPPVFSQGSTAHKAYFVSPEHYDESFKKALERDIDNIVDNTSAGNTSELDAYIGLLLREKEQERPGFSERYKQAIEELRTAVKNYVSTYTTLWNQAKWDDIGEKPGKRQIHTAMCDLGNGSVKPLLDALMYKEKEEAS
jgi:hypothetical protein